MLIVEDDHCLDTDRAAEANRAWWDAVRRQREVGLIAKNHDVAAQILAGQSGPCPEQLAFLASSTRIEGMRHHRLVAVVWVTGNSGSGKSSVCEVLKSRGHLAVDADWEGYSHWVDRVTGDVVLKRPYPVPPGWLDRFGWEINVERVRALAAETRSGTVFLCGSVENEADVWRYFDRVVCLVIDDETLRHRLATRTTNEFGKHPEELAAALAWNREAEGNCRRRGAAVIDATRPLEEVVRDVEAVAAELAGD